MIVSWVMIESIPIFLEGELVAIGPLRQRLASTYEAWERDLELASRAMRAPHAGVEGHGEPRLFREAARPGTHAFTVYETIYDSKAPRPIGFAMLANVDERHRTATYTIVLGERDTWGTGLGSAATKLVLDYAFDALGLASVELRVRTTDEQAIRAFERAGFTKVGVRRRALFAGASPEDLLVMDAVAEGRKAPAQNT